MSQDHDVQKATQPTLCAAGCGFYSNVGTNGLCSKCYRNQELEAGKQKAAEAAVAEALSAPTPAAPVAQQPACQTAAPAIPAALFAVSGVEATPSTSTAIPAAPTPPKPSPTRCLTCNKKVGLTGFSCRCNPEAVFCSQHRYAEAHACNFDYKTLQRQQLADANPVVQAAKLQKF